MKPVSELLILECDQCHNEWKVDMTSGHAVVSASPRPFTGPRDVAYYKEHGIYAAAGVPYREEEVRPSDSPSENACFAVCRSFSDRICASVQKGIPVVIPTGYCLYAPAVAGGIRRALGDAARIGVVWIDAHSDNRIAETAPGPMRFVSLPVSALAGQTYEEWRRDVCGLTVPCRGGDLLVSDARMRDEACSRNLEAAGAVCLSGEAFEDEAAWRAAAEDLAERVDAVYLSVDADILRTEDIPAYIKQVPGGHAPETVSRNIRTVMETGKVIAFSLFCFDFDLYENGGETNFRSGAALLRAGLGAWKRMPDLVPAQ